MILNPTSAPAKTVVADCVEISLDQGIVNVSYRAHAEITAEIKHDMHLVFLELTGGKKHPFIFESKGAIWYTRKAREYARWLEPFQPFLAVAVIAPTLGYRLLAEFYAKIYKPEIPYSVFKSREEAILWLRSFEM